MRPIDIAMARIAELDLAPVSEKLRTSDPERWSTESVRDVEEKYRRFLAIHLVHPGETFVPNKILDEYWHQHILDTHRYAQHCDELFGSMLHHDPYFGLRDAAELKANGAAFQHLKSLWEIYFGEHLLGESNPCSSSDCR